MSVGTSGIGSLGSATSSNLAAIGPVLNQIARTSMTDLAKLGMTAREILDGVADVSRHQLCLTAKTKVKCAYVPVISTDNITLPDTVPGNNRQTKLPGSLAETMLDMSMGSYYREVADARTELEYSLRKHQMSLHSFDTVVNENLRKFQDHLQCGNTRTHRRNSIIFGRESDFAATAHNVSEHKGTWTSIGEGSRIYKFTWTDSSDLNIQQHIRGIVLQTKASTDSLSESSTDTDENGIGMDQVILCLMALEELIHHFSMISTKVHNRSDNPSDLIEAPQLSYAGIALTDACLHPQNGDTALTLNIFSALTMNNGPFDIQCSDDLMWISNVELGDFEKDGLRRYRVALSIDFLKLILQSGDTNTTILRSYTTKFPQRNSTAIVDKLKHKPGNPSRTTFLIAPQKRGFGLLRRSSIQDKLRHIGVAISSCHASKRLDMVNGACARF